MILPHLEQPLKRGLRHLLAKLRWVVDRLVDPLRMGDGPNQFRLSSHDTATTTYHNDTGWSTRPPATLECPRCESEVRQLNARDHIDCPRCVAEFTYEEFTKLDLLYMTCPACQSRMEHGQRHPGVFDIPEWATCHNCRYHWEFKHSY